MGYWIISILLLFLGLGASAALFFSSIYGVRQYKRGLFVLYGAVSLLAGAAAVRNLLFISSPYACARLPLYAIVLSGFLLLLQLIFLWDIAKTVSEPSARK